MASPATLKAALDVINAAAEAAPMSSSEYNTQVSQAHYDFGATYVVTTPAGVAVAVSTGSGLGATTAPGVGTPS
jgi:hypothetical protein